MKLREGALAYACPLRSVPGYYYTSPFASAINSIIMYNNDFWTLFIFNTRLISIFFYLYLSVQHLSITFIIIFLFY